MTPNNALPLERTFFDIPSDREGADAILEYLSNFPDAAKLDWPRLLQSDRILIVSEAGMGKTYECKRRKQILCSNSEPAFFIELSGLGNNWASDLSPDESERFEAWQSGQLGTATFFLDSIDELKLTQKSFELALKRFAKSIQGHLGRSKIVITTRPVPFDRQLIEQYLPNPAPREAPLDGETLFADVAMGVEKKTSETGAEKIELWRHVALAPLGQAQLNQIAIGQGIQDPECLLEEIRAHNAQEFVRRPLDAIELCADWRDFGRIRSHRDQVDHGITVKLRARSDRPDRTNLAPARARTGAARLALGMLLTRKLTLYYSMDADKKSGEGALDPRVILDDWSDDEVVALLERPLFGFASYGRVRFHNRSIVEFLAAEHLRALIDRGTPVSTVKRLLFVNPNVGALAVKPTMRPVAAWLALTNDSVRAEVMRREPDLLLSMGDPESLSIPQRITALEGYVRKFGSGGWRGLRIPEVQIHRFALPELSATVAKLWLAGVENEEVRETLLKLIAAGKMTECADYAHAAAFDANRDEVERVYGLEALDALEDPRLSEALTLLALGSPGWPEDLARAVILRLFPERMGIPQLLRILKRLPDRPNQVGGAASLLPLLIGRWRWSLEELRALLRGLAELIAPSVHWDSKHHHVATKHADFVPTLVTICRLLLEAGSSTSEVLSLTATSLRVAKNDSRTEEVVRELRKAVEDLPPAARERFFTADYQFMERLNPTINSWERFCRVAFEGVLSFNATIDRDWICAALATHTRTLTEREVLLQLLMNWAQSEPEQVNHLGTLLPLVSDQCSLQRLLEDRIEQLRNTPPEPDWMIENARRAEEAKIKSAQHRERWIEFAREIAADPDRAFSGSECRKTLWNLWQVMIRSKGAEMGTRAWNRPLMESVFGRELVDRLRLAMMKLWREGQPTLLSERPIEERNRTLYVWHQGLAAITAEAEEPRWAETLTPAEAELAARYAMIEANSFPSWLEALTTAHPSSVEAIIGAQLTFELNDDSNESSCHSMALQTVGYATPKLIQLLLPRVRDWLKAKLQEGEVGGSKFANRLENSITLIIKNGSREDVDFIQTTAKRITNSSADQRSILLWLPVLMQLDPASGVAALESLARRKVLNKQEITACIANMFGEHTPRWAIDLKQPAFTPNLLLKLVLFIYKHVRPSEDRVHDGCYSPDARDNAEHGRNHVLNALLEAEGLDAWRAKLKLANNPLITHFKDRALAIAQEALAAEADRSKWSEQEVVALDHKNDFGPHTQADMTMLLEDRLSDLLDLLRKDESPRAAWALIQEERILRRQIAGTLLSIARNAYTVDQESVTADENETDVRFRSTSSSQQAVIELKIGDKRRSAAELRSDLREQLVKKYLGNDDCRTGCFLISLANSRTWMYPGTRRKLSFDQLINLLREDAKKIETEMGGAVSIRVVGLDLRAPTKH